MTPPVVPGLAWPDSITCLHQKWNGNERSLRVPDQPLDVAISRRRHAPPRRLNILVKGTGASSRPTPGQQRENADSDRAGGGQQVARPAKVKAPH
jgi:hypothetical protein